MKRMILALFAGAGLALTAVPATADDAKPATTATVTATPVVVSETTGTTSRRGIFSRLRDRRSTGTVMTAPTTVVTPSAPTTVVPSTVIPTPLPSVKPVSGTVTTGSVTTAAYSVPVTPTRTGLFSRRTRTATPVMVSPMPMPMSAVVPAAGTVTATAAPMMMMDATTTVPTRTTLMSRLRARRG